MSLADPSRRAILRELRQPGSAAAVSRRLGMPRQRVNYHLRELETAGLVRLVEERRRGNCTERVVRATAAMYLIDPGVLGDLAPDPDRVPDRTSAAYMVALAARAIREVAALREAAEAPAVSIHTDVCFATPADKAAFAEDLAQEFARLVREYHDADAPGARVCRFFVGGHPAPEEGEPTAAADTGASARRADEPSP